MRTSSILNVVLGLISVISAGNNLDYDPSANRRGCLTDHDVNAIRSRYIDFFTNFNPAIAKKSVTKGFQLFSESNIFLFGNPGTDATHAQLAAPQFNGRDAFIAGQTGVSNPGVTGSQLFNIVASDHGCNSFTFRWDGFFSGFNLAPVAGMDLVFVQQGSYLMEKAYSEYNTGHLLHEGGCQFVGGVCQQSQCVAAGCGAAPPAPKTSKKRNVFNTGLGLKAGNIGK